jgi:hypothetical protein
MNLDLSGFSEGNRQLVCRCPLQTFFVTLEIRMFVVDRSALAVILPLALLVAVVLWSNRRSPGG